MLRTSIASSHQVLSNSLRSRAAAQWLPRSGLNDRLVGQRYISSSLRLASDKQADSVVFPETRTAATSTPPPLGPASPVTPSGQTAIPPENVPKTPPPPPQSPGGPSSNASPSPAKKTGRLRRFLLYLILTSGIAYAGGVWYSLRSDNFHDFFTEYVPYGEEAVLYFEERDFYKRYPNATRQPHRLTTTTKEEGKKITVPSKSGLTWKVAEEDRTETSKKGAHNSAVGAAKTEEVKAAAKKPKAEAKAKVEEAPAKKEAPREPAIPPATTIELLKVNDADEPVVQDLVKIFNDIITVVSADNSADKFSAPVLKAKAELQKVGERIASLKNEATASAEEKIKEAHSTFDEGARELLRRVDEARAAEAAQYREEFEAERERLAKAYQDKIKVEIERANEVAEQRLRNELVEQAIELNRKFLGDIKELVERERDGRLSKLDELTSNVTELQKLTSDWNGVIDTNLKTQQLQVAVDAVRTTLESSEMPKPFVRELLAVKELAADDPVVAAAIGSINPSAYQRGIPSTAQIIDRFRRVASEVRKSDLLPEDAGIASHAASVVLSKVMFKKQATTAGDDVESVLARTENYLEEGNLDDAAREMNSLQGWAKLLSKDWLADVRKVLEVKQALEVIETEARLQCLRVE